MEFQNLRSQQQSRKNIATLLGYVLYGSLTALVACSTTPTYLPQNARTAFGNYLAKSDFKAFAVDLKTGAYGWQAGYRQPSWAVERAIQRCEEREGRCQIYAVGNRVVVDLSDEEITKIEEEYFFQIVTAPKIDERGIILSSKEIEQYISGRTLKVITNRGDEVTVTVFSNGQISARTVDRGIEDTGSWYIKDAKFCRKFRKFSMGKLGCAQLVKDGQTFRAYSNGKFMSKFTLE